MIRTRLNLTRWETASAVAAIVQVVLVAAKVAGLVDWSWWAVAVPSLVILPLTYAFADAER